MSSSKLYRMSGIMLMISAIVSIIFINTISSSFLYGFIIGIIGALGLFAYLVISLILPHGSIITLMENFSNIVLKVEIVWGIVLNAAFLFGLIGFYHRQSQRAGILGLLGFTLTFLSYLLSGVLDIYYDLFISPRIPATGISDSALHALTQNTDLFYTVANVLLLVGAPVLGISVIRAKIFSRVTGILILIGGVLISAVLLNPDSIFNPDSIVSNIVCLSTTLMCAGFVLAGYTLFRAYRKDAAI